MDIKRVTAAILKAVQSWVEPAVQDLSARMEAMNARIDNLPKADPAEISTIVREQVVAALATLPQGEKVEPAQIRSWLEEFVAARMASMPAPKDGRDADPELIASLIDARMAALPTPRDGRDADEAAIIAHVDAEIAARVSAIPAGKDGKDGKDAEPIHPDTLRLMIMSCAREVIAELPMPRDGENGKSVDLDTITALIDAKVTTKFAELPKPEKGADGKDADLSEIKTLIEVAKAEVRAEIPPPIDPDALKGEDFGDLLDELTEALDDDPIMQAGASPISVSVINGGERYHAGAEPLIVADLSARFEEMQQRMMWPTVPVYKNGRIVGAKRVPPDEFGASQ